MKTKSVNRHTGGKRILHVKNSSSGFYKVHKTGRLGKNAYTLTRKKRFVICMVNGVIIHLYVRHIKKRVTKCSRRRFPRVIM